MRYVPVAYLFGWILAILSAITLIPAAIAFNYGESRAFTAFLIGGAAMAFLGGVIILALRGRVTVVSRSEAFILLTTTWVVLPVIASLPLQLSGHVPDFTAAFFETVSGLTTTGATIFPDLSELPHAILAWRGLLQWLGGLLTLLGLAFFYGAVGRNSHLDTNVHLRRKSHGRSGWLSATAFNVIVPLYSALTAFCFILLLLSGLPTFDAFCIAMSTLSTGGFMPRNGTIQSYGSVAAIPVLTIFMYLGAVSVFWVHNLLSYPRNTKDRQREPWWIASVIGVLTLALTAYLVTTELQTGPSSILLSLLFGLATAASLVTTTGFFVTDSLMDAVPYVALLTICFVGGGRMSTAGGLKFHRLGAMLHHSGQELRRLIYPHGIVSEDVGSRYQTGDVMRTVWVNFALILIIMTGATIILSLAGLSFSASLLAAVSALSNIGPAYEYIAVTGDVAHAPYSELENFAQITLAYVMIAGRLEILALLSLINFAYWQN